MEAFVSHSPYTGSLADFFIFQGWFYFKKGAEFRPGRITVGSKIFYLASEDRDRIGGSYCRATYFMIAHCVKSRLAGKIGRAITLQLVR